MTQKTHLTTTSHRQRRRVLLALRLAAMGGCIVESKVADTCTTWSCESLTDWQDDDEPDAPCVFFADLNQFCTWVIDAIARPVVLEADAAKQCAVVPVLPAALARLDAGFTAPSCPIEEAWASVSAWPDILELINTHPPEMPATERLIRRQDAMAKARLEGLPSSQPVRPLPRL